MATRRVVSDLLKHKSLIDLRTECHVLVVKAVSQPLDLFKSFLQFSPTDPPVGNVHHRPDKLESAGSGFCCMRNDVDTFDSSIGQRQAKLQIAIVTPGDCLIDLRLHHNSVFGMRIS